MKQIDGDTLKQFSVCPETAGPSSIKSMVAELQSRRAAEQAALPAVEEMAKRLLDEAVKLADQDMEYGDKDFRAVATYDIAPLYAKLADIEQQLARNQQFVADLQKAIAERDAVLGECRSLLPSIGNIWTNNHTVDAAQEAIIRIDALLGAKGRK